MGSYEGLRPPKLNFFFRKLFFYSLTNFTTNAAIQFTICNFVAESDMKTFFQKYRRFLIVFLSISLVILWLFYRALRPTPLLPIYQPAMVHFELVDSSFQHVKKYHRIAEFKLLNQNGQWVNESWVEGKIHIADFFFTTCPSICPIMTANLFDIQELFSEDDQIRLLSFSVTPEIDSVAQLKKYALEKGVKDQKWNLLTGDKKEIYRLARQSYLVAKEDGDGGPYDMIHTENFVLVDPERRIRGFYDGTDPASMEELVKDVAILQKEFSP